LFGREIELFVEVVGKGSERAVIGEPLKDLADVGDPEGPVKTFADFLELLAKDHGASQNARRDDSRTGPRGRGDTPSPVFSVLRQLRKC
jgi:hypothetical protein